MIWVIAGTSDARELIEKLLLHIRPVIATTATEEGAKLVTSAKGLAVEWGKMNADEMVSFITGRKITLVIDASHPYAGQVSVNAVKASGKSGIRYIRFERPGTSDIQADFKGSYDQIASYLSRTEGNVLLTIGSNNLFHFSSLDPDRLYARVLPSPSSIQKCLDVKIAPSHIIAAQGPFSAGFNKAMMEEFSISYLVTKDSGLRGGFPGKREAAARCGVKLLLVERPVVNYPLVFSDIDTLINALFS